VHVVIGGFLLNPQHRSAHSSWGGLEQSEVEQRPGMQSGWVQSMPTEGGLPTVTGTQSVPDSSQQSHSQHQ